MDVFLWFHFLKFEITIRMGAGSSVRSQESSGSWGARTGVAEIRNPRLLILPSHTHRYVLSASLNIVVVTKMIKT